MHARVLCYMRRLHVCYAWCITACYVILYVRCIYVRCMWRVCVVRCMLCVWRVCYAYVRCIYVYARCMLQLKLCYVCYVYVTVSCIIMVIQSLFVCTLTFYHNLTLFLLLCSLSSTWWILSSCWEKHFKSKWCFQDSMWRIRIPTKLFFTGYHALDE